MTRRVPNAIHHANTQATALIVRQAQDNDRVAERPLPPSDPSTGHFPTEQAALNCLYLVTRSLDPTGRGRARWTMRWKPALNAFAITFTDRWPAA